MAPAKKLTVTALAGGIGASKLLLGLYGAMDPRDLTVIVNTGDDIVMHGLKISPDLDIVTYTLAGVVNPTTGWGMRGETFHFLKRLGVYGREIWFNLGDRDLATHIHRTDMLAHGKTLTQAAESIRVALGVKSRILPMSDQPIPTIIETRDGNMHFQEYLVKHRTEPGSSRYPLRGDKACACRAGRSRSDLRRGSRDHLSEQSLDQHWADTGRAARTRAVAGAERKRDRRVPDRWRKIAERSDR